MIILRAPQESLRTGSNLAIIRNSTHGGGLYLVQSIPLRPHGTPTAWYLKSNCATTAFARKTETLPAMMDRRHVRTIVDFTDRYGRGLAEAICMLDKAHPDWSFGGKGFLSNPELQQAPQCVIERDPRSGESGLHPLAVIGMGV